MIVIVQHRIDGTLPNQAEVESFASLGKEEREKQFHDVGVDDEFRKRQKGE